MCKQLPASCPDDGTALIWANYGSAVCQTGDHSLWLPSLSIPDGHRFSMTIPKGKGQVTVAFQEECENCQWPAVDNRFLPDVDTMPAPLPGTVWMEARELRTGMQVRLGFSYALTVTDVQIRSGEGNQPDRTYLTVAPPARCGDPFDLHCCADAPMCVEGTR